MSKCPFISTLQIALLVGVAALLFGWRGVAALAVLLVLVLLVALWDWFNMSGLRRKLGWTDRF